MREYIRTPVRQDIPVNIFVVLIHSFIHTVRIVCAALALEKEVVTARKSSSREFKATPRHRVD